MKNKIQEALQKKKLKDQRGKKLDAFIAPTAHYFLSKNEI